MTKLPRVSGKNLISVLQKFGFRVLRVKGSHILFGHGDGRRVVITMHKGKNLKEGLVHKIITKEIGISIDEFFNVLRRG